MYSTKTTKMKASKQSQTLQLHTKADESFFFLSGEPRNLVPTSPSLNQLDIFPNPLVSSWTGTHCIDPRKAYQQKEKKRL